MAGLTNRRILGSRNELSAFSSVQCIGIARNDDGLYVSEGGGML